MVASTQGSKAAGAIGLLGAQWAKVYTAHQAWTDSRGEQRLVTMEFKANQRVGDDPLERMLVVAPYGYNNPMARSHREPSASMWGKVAKIVGAFRKNHKQGTVVLA